jgi:hypothetical protein
VVPLTKSFERFIASGLSQTLTPGIYADSDFEISVYKDGALLTNGSDYTLSGVGSASGVAVQGTFTAGSTILVKRTSDLRQLTDIRNNETLLEEVMEQGFDHAAMVDQELQGQINGTIRTPVGETIPFLPAQADRAAKFMQWAIDGASVLMLSASALAMVVAPSVVPLLGAGFKGDPGGTAMAIGLKTFASGLNIPLGTDLVQTSGYATVGKGAARYNYDATVDAAYAAANPRISFYTTNGRGFKLAESIVDLRQVGAAADLATDDHDAMAAATALNRPISLGGANYKLTGGHTLQGDAAVYGPGRLDFDASASQWLFTLGVDGGGVDVSNPTIERVHFTSSTDRGFMHFVRCSNSAGKVDRFHFNFNIIDYTPGTIGSGDRWVIACSGGGDRTNWQICFNQSTGPIQLTAGLVATGRFINGLIGWNRIHNAKSNAISLSTSGTVGSPCSVSGTRIVGNHITATDYTSIGIFAGLDNSGADRNAYIGLTIEDNIIDISASPVKTADLYFRFGNKAANIGGFDSDARILVKNGNEFNYGINVDQPTPVTASGFSRASTWKFVNNGIFGSDISFRDLGDGAVFSGNTLAAGSFIRPSVNNGIIRSSGNEYTSLIPLTADAEFTWYHQGDNYFGNTSGTDWPVQLNPNAGKVQKFFATGGSIDSFTSGTKRAMIKTSGAGTATATLKRVGTNTAWALARIEQITGSITDDGG